MKLTIDRMSLLRPLGHVQSVVERRNTIPILANVVLRAEAAFPEAALRLEARELAVRDLHLDREGGHPA